MHERVVTAPRTIFPFQGRIPGLLLQVSLFFQKKNAAYQGSQSCLDKDLECEAPTFIFFYPIRRDSSLSSLLASDLGTLWINPFLGKLLDYGGLGCRTEQESHGFVYVHVGGW